MNDLGEWITVKLNPPWFDASIVDNRGNAYKEAALDEQTYDLTFTRKELTILLEELSATILDHNDRMTEGDHEFCLALQQRLMDVLGYEDPFEGSES